MTFLLVVASLALWSFFYFLLCWSNPRRSCEWHCRTVTTVHATVITGLATWCCFVQGPWPFTEAGGPNTPFQHFIICICLGYFTFDFSWCIYFGTEGLPMMAHHLLSICGLTVSLLTGMYGTELMATVCGAEATNPLLQLRWFLRETKRYDTVLGEVVDVLFMLTFGVLRIGVASYLLYCYFQQPTDFLGRMGGVSIYLVGWVFWVFIVRYAVKKYTKMWRATRAKTTKTRSRAENGVTAAGSTRRDATKTDKHERIGTVSQADGKELINGVANGYRLCVAPGHEKKL